MRCATLVGIIDVARRELTRYCGRKKKTAHLKEVYPRSWILLILCHFDPKWHKTKIEFCKPILNIFWREKILVKAEILNFKIFENKKCFKRLQNRSLKKKSKFLKKWKKMRFFYCTFMALKLPKMIFFAWNRFHTKVQSIL